MSDIDKQRVAAIQTLERIGFVWGADGWVQCSPYEYRDATLIEAADEMYSLLDTIGERKASLWDEAERQHIADILRAYDEWRRAIADGKVPGGNK